MSCMWATVCCLEQKQKRRSRPGQATRRKEMWESTAEKAEDCSYITRVKSLWLHPDQPWLPVLRPTSRIKGQLWRNLNTTGTDGYFLQERLRRIVERIVSSLKWKPSWLQEPISNNHHFRSNLKGMSGTQNGPVTFAQRSRRCVTGCVFWFTAVWHHFNPLRLASRSQGTRHESEISSVKSRVKCNGVGREA